MEAGQEEARGHRDRHGRLRERYPEDLAQELERENYLRPKRITAQKDNILRLWDYLQELLRARRLQRLEKTLTLQKLFQDMLHSIDWMDGIIGSLGTPAPPPEASVSCASAGHLPAPRLSQSRVPKAAECLRASCLSAA